MSLTVHDKQNDQNSISYHTSSHGVVGFLHLMLLLFRPTFRGLCEGNEGSEVVWIAAVLAPLFR